MSRPNVIKALGVGFLTVFLLVSPRNAVSEGTILKIATLAPEGSVWIQTFEDLNAELKKKTNNAVQLRIYPGAKLTIKNPE